MVKDNGSLDTRIEAANCPQAPTDVEPFGKHWWVIPMAGARPVGRCKFCGEERAFDNSCRDGQWDARIQHKRSMEQHISHAYTFSRQEEQA